MKILAIGDIFGKIGRKIIKCYLAGIKQEYQIDLVIANVENATHGKGISFKHYQELKNSANKKIRVTNLIGIAFMPPAENPYFALEKLLENDKSDIHLIDFHAETTAEKAAFAHYFAGKITALWGTHTHVQTADERILPPGTAFITDLGMTGPSEGIIGAEPAGIIQRSKYNFSSPMRPCEKGQGQFNGLVLEIDDNSNKQEVQIQRKAASPLVPQPPPPPQPPQRPPPIPQPRPSSQALV
ncbi:20035_t:CDS:2 [Entrophospora sp. SA101]|nr:20035_t:CDS:2 [Entrophospora sp. SA101]